MAIEDEIALLQQAQIFQGVEISHLRLLAVAADRVSFKPGEVMLRENDPAEDILLILKGRVKTSTDFELHTLVGYLGVFLRKPYTTTIIAETPVEALRLSAHDFLELMGHCNQISLAVIKELSRIIDTMLSVVNQGPMPTANDQPNQSGGVDGQDHD